MTGAHEGFPWSLKDEVNYVRILWCDTSGHRCSGMVPFSRFKANDISTVGIGLPLVLLEMPSPGGNPAGGSEHTTTGDFRLVPDMDTLRVLPQYRHALVLGDVQERLGLSSEYCPRGTLRRLEHLLQTEFGLEMRAGFGIEFYLLRQLDSLLKYEVVDCSPAYSSSGLNNSLHVVETMLSWMETLGVVVDQFLSKGGQGQFGCVLAHDNASKSADNLLLAREGLTAAAMSHQLVSTFLPKPPVEGATSGSGIHVHLSIWNAVGENVLAVGPSSDANFGLSDQGSSFIAGVLHHLPALMAIISPHPNSYERIHQDIISHSNAWRGAYQCWSLENREAPLQAGLDVKTGAVKKFELKSFDGCANPHMGLAAVLASGLDGLRKRMHLPFPIDVNPWRVQKLPVALEDARDCLEKDDVLKDMLGHKLTAAILAVRNAEIEYFSENPIKCTFPLEPHLAPLLQMY